MFGDRQSQPRTAIFPCCRCIRLGERLEQILLCHGREANTGIRTVNRIMGRCRLADQGYADCNLALLRELDGIADEIEQDLA